jgi:hypothetical protein
MNVKHSLQYFVPDRWSTLNRFSGEMDITFHLFLLVFRGNSSDNLVSIRNPSQTKTALLLIQPPVDWSLEVRMAVAWGSPLPPV